MNPIVIDPHNYNKYRAFAEAKDFCWYFCEANNITPPVVLKNSNRFHHFGFWWKNEIHINMKACPNPVKEPFRMWSYTGYKADRTVTGVIAHEMGHHVHFNSFKRDYWVERFGTKEMQAAKYRVSGYEPVVNETIAESMRLFILNPDLLRVIAPPRFELFLELGLKPIVDLKWEEVLMNAHPKMINSIKNRIK